MKRIKFAAQKNNTKQQSHKKNTSILGQKIIANPPRPFSTLKPERSSRKSKGVLLISAKQEIN
jgi:hypothetical protein